MNSLIIEVLIFLIVVFPFSLYYRKKYPRSQPFTADLKETFDKAKKGDIFSVVFILGFVILALIVMAAYAALIGSLFG